MNDLSCAVVTAINHGLTEQLLKGGLNAEWIPDSDARVVYETAVDLYRSGRRVNALSVLVNAQGKLQNLTEVKHLFSLNGTGEVGAVDVVRGLRDSNLRAEALKLNQKLSQLIAKKPDEIYQWLPMVAQKIQALTLSGRAYDARPSPQWGSIVRPVVFKSSLPTFNRMFEGNAEDGGGWRLGYYEVWIGPTGFGKSTNGATIGVDACNQGRRISWVAKEEKDQVTGRLLLALTHLTLDEINNRKAEAQDGMTDRYGRRLTDEFGRPLMVSDGDGNIIGAWHEQPVRQRILDDWFALVYENVRIYPWYDYFREDLGLVKNIISWDAPDILIVDFLGPEDVKDKEKAYGLGAISAHLEELAHTTGANINAFYQMSNTETTAYKKNKLHVVPGPYGSGAVAHSADVVIQTRKDDIPDRQHYLRTKLRAGGPIEEFEMAYDRHRWVYCELTKPVPIQI